MKIQSTVFWDVTPCRLVCTNVVEESAARIVQGLRYIDKDTVCKRTLLQVAPRVHLQNSDNYMYKLTYKPVTS